MSRRWQINGHYLYFLLKWKAVLNDFFCEEVPNINNVFSCTTFTREDSLYFINLSYIECEAGADMIQFSFKRKKSRPRFNKDFSCSLFLTAADSGRERETDTLELLVVLCAPWWRWCVVWCGVVGGQTTFSCWNSAMAWFGGGQAQHSSPSLCITFHPKATYRHKQSDQRFEY